MIDDPTDRTESADWGRVGPVLDSAIDQLGERDRTAIVLRFVDKRTFADIGAALHISEDAARMRVERSLERLRVTLKQRGIPSTAAALGVAMAEHVAVAAPSGLAGTVTTAALAGGSVSALSVVGFIGFMSTSKIVLGVAGLAAAVAIGTAGYQLHQLGASRASVAAADAANARLAAAVRETDLSADAAETAAADARKSAQQQRPGTRGAEQGTSVAQATETQALADGTALMQRHPELKKLLTDLRRAEVETQFRDWIKRNGLSPATAELFLQNMVGDGILWQGDLSNGSRVAIRLDRPTGPGVEAANQELMEKFGLDREAFLRDIRGEFIGQYLAKQVASAVYFTTEPLSPEQAGRLAQIASAASGRGLQINDKIRIDLDETIANSATVLSPLQVGALQSIQTQFRYRAALNEAMRENAAKSGGQTPTQRSSGS